MPKIIVNGVTVEMTVDELIEYQLKTSSAKTEPLFVKSDAKVDILPKKEALSATLSDEDELDDSEPIVEVVEYTHLEDIEDSGGRNRQYVGEVDEWRQKQRDAHKRLVDYGYSNVTTAVNTVRVGNLFNRNIGTDGDLTSINAWLLERSPGEVEFINEIVSAAIRLKNRKYVRGQHVYVPATSIALWHFMYEFGYDEMHKAIACCNDDAFLYRLAAMQKAAIAEYFEEKKITKPRQRAYVDDKTRLVIAQKTFDMIFNCAV